MLLNPTLTEPQILQLYERSCRSEIRLVEQTLDNILKELRERGIESALGQTQELAKLGPLFGVFFNLFLNQAISVLHNARIGMPSNC